MLYRVLRGESATERRYTSVFADVRLKPAARRMNFDEINRPRKTAVLRTSFLRRIRIVAEYLELYFRSDRSTMPENVSERLFMSLTTARYWIGFFRETRNTVELSGEKKREILERCESIMYGGIIGRSEKLTEIDRLRWIDFAEMFAENKLLSLITH